MTNAKAAYIHHAGPAANLSQLTVSTVVASAVAISPGCLAVHQSNPELLLQPAIPHPEPIWGLKALFRMMPVPSLLHPRPIRA